MDTGPGGGGPWTQGFSSGFGSWWRVISSKEGIRPKLPGRGRGGRGFPATPSRGSRQVVHRVRQLHATVGVAAVQVAVLVTDVQHDVVAERLDVLAGARLVLD